MESKQMKKLQIQNLEDPTSLSSYLPPNISNIQHHYCNSVGSSHQLENSENWLTSCKWPPCMIKF